MVSPVVGVLAARAIKWLIDRVSRMKKHAPAVNSAINTLKLTGANTEIVEKFWGQMLGAEKKALAWEKKAEESVRVFDRARAAAHNRQTLELNEGEVVYLDLVLRGVRWLKKKTR